MVGYAHTDVQWLWEWPEAKHAVFVTWRQALKFMDEFPDFTFSQSTAGYYKAMEETYPDLFKQVQKRVKELARQISDDYRGQTIQALAVLENAFIFMADLVRALEVPVVCQFIKPKYSKQQGAQTEIVEIFFSHEPDIRGQHILLVEGVVHSGVTSEFLMNDLRARGAASVKLVTLLDRQSARRVALQPDYFGFRCV